MSDITQDLADKLASVILEGIEDGAEPDAVLTALEIAFIETWAQLAPDCRKAAARNLKSNIPMMLRCAEMDEEATQRVH
jgi:hypothetical protein